MDFVTKLVFPAAIAWNMFSATGLLIILGLTGRSDLAAEFGVVQAATLAVFMTFSANARNLILGDTTGQTDYHLFRFRVVLLPVLAGLAFALGRGVVAVPIWLAVAIVLRRCSEWLADLQISEREKADDRPFAYRFCGMQIGFLAALVLSIQGGNHFLFQLSFAAWALSPLFQSGPYLMRMLGASISEPFRFAALIPHLGSSWVIAISTYVFRIMLVLLAGKGKAGLLFSAYAAGGMISSLYTYALGPSLLLIGEPRMNQRIKQLTWATVMILLLIGATVVFLAPSGLDREGGLLATAVGFSLIGGGIMMLAQKKRIVILQVENRNVFVPDILANILLIATVPFAFYLFREKSLVILFLWSATLNSVFYYLTAASFRRSLAAWMSRFPRLLGRISDRQKLQGGIMFLLFLPLFFQLSFKIFQSPDIIFDSQGKLTLLPLPLAVPACFLGLILLLREREVQRTVTALFLTFILMLLTTFLVAEDINKELLGKIILLCQVILPWFALPLGRSYQEPERFRYGLEGVYLAVLWLIVPLELLATWQQGTGFLTPYLYFFSIYQHLQYMPTLFAGFFFLAVATFAERRERHFWLLGLSPLMGAYAAASASTLAMLLTGTGCVMVLLTRRGGWPFSAVLALSCLVSLGCYTWLLRDNPLFHYKFQYLLRTGGGGMVNIHERWHYWHLYLDGVLDGARAFLFGHGQRFPREVAPSAHNYFLDMAYNFGVVSLLPLAYLSVHTCGKIYRRMRAGTLVFPLAAHALLWCFFILVDNSLKVGLRQPYPGMVVFFLWGVLLTRLEAFKSPGTD
jgi:hypothetical protein